MAIRSRINSTNNNLIISPNSLLLNWTTSVLLSWCLLLMGMAGCHAAPDPAPVAPFLGHWQADTERPVRHAASGQINHDTTVAHRQEFEFATATYAKLDYTRNGVALAVPMREN